MFGNFVPDFQTTQKVISVSFDEPDQNQGVETNWSNVSKFFSFNWSIKYLDGM